MTGEINRDPLNRVKGATPAEGQFRRKFEDKAQAKTGAYKKGRPAEEQSYLEEKRAEIRRAGRVSWNWLAGDPLKDPDKESYTYKVRGGKLTVTDKDGRVIRESRERGLDKYNGVTLHGKDTGKEHIELKSTLRSKRKLKSGNEHLTPREENEEIKAQLKSKAQFLLSLKDIGKKKPKLFANGFMDKAARAGLKHDRRKRAKNWREGRMH